MEFKAIVDAKAREPSGCAVVGVYENGDLGIARAVDRRANRRADRPAARARGFCRETRRHSAVAAAAGAASARMLLVGLGPRAAFGRKQYRKALQSSAQALTKTGASDAVVYLAMEEVPALELQYRARIVAEVFCAQAYKIPDLKTGAKPKPVKLALRQRGRRECARGQIGGARPQDRRRDRQRTGLVARFGEPAAQHLHAHLHRAARRRLGQRMAAHQNQGTGRERHQGA